MSTIANPDKLRHLGPVADVRALLREGSQAVAADAGEANRS